MVAWGEWKIEKEARPRSVRARGHVADNDVVKKLLQQSQRRRRHTAAFSGVTNFGYDIIKLLQHVTGRYRT